MTTVVQTPTVIDFELAPHSDVTLEFQLTNAAGDPIDITLDRVELTVYESSCDGELLLEKQNDPGDHEDPTDGRTRFTLDAEDSAFVDGADAIVRYEVWRMVEVIGARTPWFRGVIYFHKLRGPEEGS